MHEERTKERSAAVDPRFQPFRQSVARALVAAALLALATLLTGDLAGLPLTIILGLPLTLLATLLIDAATVAGVVARTRCKGSELACPVVVLALIGALAVAVDIRVMPGRFPRMHMMAFVLGIFFSTAAAILIPRLRARWLVLALALDIAAATAPRWQILAMTPAPAGSPWAGYWQLFRRMDGLLDRDNDGYSALFGNDCDDNDASAYPLSTRGRDCLGWVPISVPNAPAPPLSPRHEGPVPAVIVLVTVDAFRCGFGEMDRAELRDVCPDLARYRREGQLRKDAYTRAPITAESMAALHLGRDQGGPVGDLLQLPATEPTPS